MSGIGALRMTTPNEDVSVGVSRGGVVESSIQVKNVPLTAGRSILSATESREQVCPKLDNQNERVADRLLLRTGRCADVARYGFLAPKIINSLRPSGGYPQLELGFESSVPGWHSLAAPATWSHGPLMNFVSGTRFAAGRLVEQITKNVRTT